jgi:hypothetical protein
MMVGKGELIDYKIWNIIGDGGGTTCFVFLVGFFLQVFSYSKKELEYVQQ